MQLTTIYNSGRSRTVDVSEWHPTELNETLVRGIMDLDRAYLLDGEPVHLMTVICGSLRKTTLIADTLSNTAQAFWLFDHEGCPCEGAIKRGAFGYDANGNFREIPTGFATTV